MKNHFNDGGCSVTAMPPLVLESFEYSDLCGVSLVPRSAPCRPVERTDARTWLAGRLPASATVPRSVGIAEYRATEQS